MTDEDEPVVPARLNVDVEDVLRWRTRLRGVKEATLPIRDGRTNPVVVGRTVYCVTFSPGVVWALDARTGDVTWRTKIGRLAGPTVLVTGPALFTRTARELFCIRRRDGRVLWTFRPYETEGESVYTSPTVSGALVVVADRRGVAHAVSARTGRLVWSADVGTGDSVNATALDARGVLVFGTNGHEVVGVTAETGAIRWRTSIDAPCITAPRSLGPTAVLQTNRTLYWVDTRTGRVRGKWTSTAGSVRSFEVVGSRVFVVAEDGDAARLFILKAGKVARELPHPGFGMADGLSFEKTRDIVFDARICALGILDGRTGERLIDVTGFDAPLGTPASAGTSTFVVEGKTASALDNAIITRARRVSPSRGKRART